MLITPARGHNSHTLNIFMPTLKYFSVSVRRVAEWYGDAPHLNVRRPPQPRRAGHPRGAPRGRRATHAEPLPQARHPTSYTQQFTPDLFRGCTYMTSLFPV